MTDDERRKEWEKAIATYREAHLDLVRIGIVLREQGRDLTHLKETIDGLSEREVKELLTISVGWPRAPGA